MMLAEEDISDDGSPPPSYELFTIRSKTADPLVAVLEVNDSTLRMGVDTGAALSIISESTYHQLWATGQHPPVQASCLLHLQGGSHSRSWDLAHDYLQVPLSEEAKKCVTINTHRGLYQYNRLPFGIVSVPAIFQRTMDTLLLEIPHTSAYIDDILITGASETEHLANLAEVLSRLETVGMRLKQDKCAFLLPQVEYLGHTIFEKGLQPSPEKVRAIVDAPAPCDVSQLKSFLGMINY